MVGAAKYQAYEQDERVAKEIAALLKIPVFDHPIVLEGGSIEVNGAGTCLTTEQCLLNKNRNPHLRRDEIEDFLKESLGVSHIIWLGEGIVGDDTDGHIDDIARFVAPSTVVCVVEADSKDENYSFLQENYERLQSATNENGEKFPSWLCPVRRRCAMTARACRRVTRIFILPTSVVLAPVFDDPNDAKALGILQELFPERRVVGLRCNEVVAGLGAIHCVTQQEPEASCP